MAPETPRSGAPCQGWQAPSDLARIPEENPAGSTRLERALDPRPRPSLESGSSHVRHAVHAVRHTNTSSESSLRPARRPRNLFLSRREGRGNAYGGTRSTGRGPLRRPGARALAPNRRVPPRPAARGPVPALVRAAAGPRPRRRPAPGRRPRPVPPRLRGRQLPRLVRRVRPRPRRLAAPHPVRGRHRAPAVLASAHGGAGPGRRLAPGSRRDPAQPPLPL